MLSKFALSIIEFINGVSSDFVVFEHDLTNALSRIFAKFVNDVEVEFVGQFDQFKETYFEEDIKDGAAFTLGSASKWADIHVEEIIMDFDSVGNAKLVAFEDKLILDSKLRAIVIVGDIIGLVNLVINMKNLP